MHRWMLNNISGYAGLVSEKIPNIIIIVSYIDSLWLHELCLVTRMRLCKNNEPHHSKV